MLQSMGREESDTTERLKRTELKVRNTLSNSISYNIIILRESIPRQVDKKSGGPQGEKGLEFSRRRKGQTFFPSIFFSLSHINCFYL